MLFDVVIGFVGSVLIAGFSIKKGLLTAWGAVLSVATGTLYGLFGSWRLWVLLILFFLSANLISRLRDRYFPSDGKMKKDSPRNAYQVLCNSLPALIGGALFFFTGTRLYLVIACGAIAAAAADTWASEIGILSRRLPVSILTGRPMGKGLSGGVSALGLFCTLLGSAFIALAALLLYGHALLFRETQWNAFSLIAVCGVFGSIIDSFLGATVQAKFRCADMDVIVEKRLPGEGCALVSGIAWVNNDLVNVASGLIACVLCILLGRPAL